MHGMRVGRVRRPNVFKYNDYRKFLRDWIDYSQSSIRSFSKRSGLSPGYLPLILSGKRNLTLKSLIKLEPHLKLEPQEISYLKLLTDLSDEKKEDERNRVHKRIQKFRISQDLDVKSIENYQYMSKWYIPVIRELISIRGFKRDAKWIQAQINSDLALEEIEEALRFLEKHGFIQSTADGSAERKQREVICHDGIYRMALGQFHQEMFEQAGLSFERTPRSQRKIKSYTVAIEPSQFSEAKRIIDRAHEELSLLSMKEKKPKESQVYHFSLCAFPLSQRKKKDE